MKTHDLILIPIIALTVACNNGTPGICTEVNSSEIISFRDSITFTGDELMLPTVGIDDPNQYLTRDTISGITQGIYFARTYYDLSDQEVEVPDDDCCGE